MEYVTANDCETVVEKWFAESKATLLDYEIIGNDSSMGFLGSTQTLRLSVEHEGRLRELRLFVKVVPEGNEFLKEFITRNQCSRKEHTFYSQIAAHLSFRDSVKVFPKCFVSRENEVMIMEDLMGQGYRTREPRECLDGEHCEKALEAVAGLHAASLVWEELNGTTLDALYPDLMTESYYARAENNPGFNHLTTSTRAVKMIFEHYAGDRPRELIEEALALYEGLPELLNPSAEHRNVLSHGDLWCNNIMFNYDGRVKSACLVDFQLMRYNPPALDVLSLLYLNTEAEWRTSNMEALLGHYYRALKTKIAEAGLDPDRLISWNRFLESRDQVEPLALVIATLFLHLVLIDEARVKAVYECRAELEKFMKEDRNWIVRESIENDPLYKRRVVGAALDLLDYLAKKKTRVETK